MQVKDTIELIKQEIIEISSERPEFLGLANSSLHAIQASAERADLWESRLSKAARLTVAAGAMDFVSSLLTIDKNDIVSISHKVNKIIDLSCIFSPLEFPNHETSKGVKPPVNWSGPVGGPFRHKVRQNSLIMAQRKSLPGGDWTLFYRNMPVTFGRDTEEVAEKAEKFIWLRSLT